MKNSIKLCALVVLLAFSFSSSGCDQIKSLTNAFTKKKTASKTSVPAQPSVPAGPQAQPKTAASSTSSANVLARVGDWTITIEDFKERLEALKKEVPDYDSNNVELNKKILENLINQQLLVQDAERSGVGDKKEIAQAIEEFRRMLMAQEVAAKITENVTVTEEDAQTYYNENPTEFTEPAEWRVREIVVEKEEEAKQLLIEIINGADFIEAASSKSKAKSVWKKGDLGFRSTFDFPKMESVVAALEVGGVSSVFKGPEGYYIVKLEEKKGGETKAFADVKEQLINVMTMYRQQEAVMKYLEQLRKNTVVEVKDKLLEG